MYDVYVGTDSKRILDLFLRFVLKLIGCFFGTASVIATTEAPLREHSGCKVC